MRVWLIAAAAACIASSVQAQAPTTTSCRAVGDQVVCNTQVQSQQDITPRNTYQEAYDAAAQRSANTYNGLGAAIRGGLGQSEQAAQERLRVMNEEVLLKRLGGYVAEGRCEHAYNVALKEGRLDLAKEVQALCVAPAATQ